MVTACLQLLLLMLCHSVNAQNRSLDYYINTALSNSPLLKDYKNQTVANNIDSQRVRATLKPQVSFISYNSYAPIVNGWGYDQTLSNIANFNEWVNINKSFASQSNLSTQYNGIKLVNDSIFHIQRLTEQELKRNITAQYITTYGDLEQLHFYTGVNEMLHNQEVILKTLAQSNVYRQTDYLTFLVTLKQQELQLKQMHIQYRNDYAMLNYLCGIFDTSDEVLMAPNIVLQQLPDSTISAFFQRYKTNSLLLANTAKMLRYSYKPKLSAFANAGYSSTLAFEAYKNFGLGAGISLNVPIYDGHQRTLQQKKIELSIETNERYKDFFARQYDQQIAMLRQQLTSTESLISEINDQIRYSEELINVNSKLLETGDTKVADFVIAINNYLTAKNLLTQNNISRMQIINQINYWNR